MTVNKAEMIQRIQNEHDRFLAALEQIPPQGMETTTSPDAWTAKETLAHITYWEQVLLADHARLKRGEPIHELAGEEEINAVNAATRRRATGRKLNDVLGEFHASYRQLLDWLATLSEVDLAHPFAYGMTLGEFITEDTWKHYAEHNLLP